jgi:hypothetical protein
MDHVWAFSRNGSRMAVIRRDNDGDVKLVIVAGGQAPKTYTFDQETRLNSFQSDMQAFLVRTGWRFVGFRPERRSRFRDRRCAERMRERRSLPSETLMASPCTDTRRRQL